MVKYTLFSDKPTYFSRPSKKMNRKYPSLKNIKKQHQFPQKKHPQIVGFSMNLQPTQSKYGFFPKISFFPWFSHGFSPKNLFFPWFSHGFPMENPMENPMVFPPVPPATRSHVEGQALKPRGLGLFGFPNLAQRLMAMRHHGEI